MYPGIHRSTVPRRRAAATPGPPDQLRTFAGPTVSVADQPAQVAIPYVGEADAVRARRHATILDPFDPGVDRTLRWSPDPQAARDAAQTLAALCDTPASPTHRAVQPSNSTAKTGGITKGKSGMNEQEPQYLGITDTDGEGWKILVTHDPRGELARIQSRITAGEVFTSATVTTNSRGQSQEVTFDSPVASCELLPAVPTAIRGTLTRQEDRDRYTFTPEQGRKLHPCAPNGFTPRPG